MGRVGVSWVLVLCGACGATSSPVNDGGTTQSGSSVVASPDGGDGAGGADAPAGPGGAGCGQARLSDLGEVTPHWRLLVPPHGIGESGVERQLDAMLDTCDGLISVAHDPGPGGKVFDPGPGHVLFSSDGLAWQGGLMAADAFYGDVAHDGDTLVAVGRHIFGEGPPGPMGTIALADRRDASAFREVFTHDDAAFSAIAHGDAGFVAVIQYGVAFSPDGEHWQWTEVPSPSLYSDVAYGGGRFVVAGVGATLSSSDGIHWEESSCGDPVCQQIQPPTGPPLEYLALQQVDYLGGAFYAFGASGNLRSVDGRVFVPMDTRMPDAASGDTLLSFTGLQGEAPRVGVSEDGGHTWTDHPLELGGDTADCQHDPCIVTPRGLLVAEAE